MAEEKKEYEPFSFWSNAGTLMGYGDSLNNIWDSTYPGVELPTEMTSPFRDADGGIDKEKAWRFFYDNPGLVAKDVAKQTINMQDYIQNTYPSVWGRIQAPASSGD